MTRQPRIKRFLLGMLTVVLASGCETYEGSSSSTGNSLSAWAQGLGTLVGIAALNKQQSDNQKAQRSRQQQYLAQQAAAAQTRDYQNWQKENERLRTQNQRQAEEQQRMAAAQRQPRTERVNLPGQSGCMRSYRPKQNPNAMVQYVHIQNQCPYSVTAHWCEGSGCSGSHAAHTFSGGEVYKAPIIRDGVINVAGACQAKNGEADVHWNRGTNQCWSWVVMN